MAIADFLATGGYDHHLRRMRRFYAEQVQRMTEAICRNFPEGTKVTRPSGGQVLWVELPESIDSLDYADPRAADLRYRQKVFHLQGRVERFDEKPFVRRFAVVLETQGRLEGVVWEFLFREEFKAVFTTEAGRALVGVTTSGRKVRLMEVGEVVLLKGKCSGRQSRGAVAFSQCERVR